MHLKQRRHPSVMEMYLTQHQLSKNLARIYGDDQELVRAATERFTDLEEQFHEHFGGSPTAFASTPGRVELCGNHTDHNHGCVLAAAVHLDSIAAAATTQDHVVTILSEGYGDAFRVDLHQLEAVPEEAGTTHAIIRGIAARLRALGHATGGFSAAVTSEVLPGSGLSSSASFEVLIATLFNALFNGGAIDAARLAQIGQYAENTYFGKPCGLMDQMTCALGGIVNIDFAEPSAPLARPVKEHFAEHGLSLLVVNTGGSHADLTADYAAVPLEMKAVAGFLGQATLRDLSLTAVLDSVTSVRAAVGDRAFLRALHYYTENERVSEQVLALERNDIDAFLRIMQASGSSSCRWLQNCSTFHDPREEALMVALGLTEWYIGTTGRGACRVHGGGFAGTILAALPHAAVPDYCRLMERVYGQSAVTALRIRKAGTTAFFTT